MRSTGFPFGISFLLELVFHVIQQLHTAFLGIILFQTNPDFQHHFRITQLRTSTFNMHEVSIVPSSLHLCNFCKSIKWPEFPLPHRQQSRRQDLPHKTFAQLQESADEGCSLCQFLWSSIINQEDITKQNIKLLATMSLEYDFGRYEDGMLMFLDMESQNTSINGGILFSCFENKRLQIADEEARQIICNYNNQPYQI